jgi:hypothetical protein
MKQNLKRNIVAALLIAMPALMTAPAFAGTTEPVAVVKLAGYKNAQPIYSLNIENPDNDKITITITDQDGTVLHEETATGLTISRNYMFNKHDLGNNTISFEISRKSDPVVSKIRIQS